MAILLRLAEQRPTSLTALQLAGLARLLVLLRTQAADCRDEVRAGSSLMEDSSMLVLRILPNWHRVQCSCGSVGGGRSAAGGQPAAQAEGVEEGLAVLVLRLHIGLAGLLFSFVRSLGPESVMADLAATTAKCPDVIQGEWKGAPQGWWVAWVAPPSAPCMFECAMLVCC